MELVACRTSGKTLGMARASIRWMQAEGTRLVAVKLPEARVSMLIGRSESSAIHVADDAAVSRTHAELSHLQGVWLVEDLGSRAGTYVLRGIQSTRVDGRARLHHGDCIKVGRTILRFEDPPVAAEEVMTVLVEAGTVALTKREPDDMTFGPHLVDARRWAATSTASPRSCARSCCARSIAARTCSSAAPD